MIEEDVPTSEALNGEDVGEGAMEPWQPVLKVPDMRPYLDRRPLAELGLPAVEAGRVGGPRQGCFVPSGMTAPVRSVLSSRIAPFRSAPFRSASDRSA